MSQIMMNSIGMRPTAVPLTLEVRYPVRFSAVALLPFALFALSIVGQSPAPAAGQASAQEQASNAPAPQVVDAESLMAKQDWKGAEAALAKWLTTHPEDERALFDAGYVADAQNHLDDAANFYGRALKINPKSFEAHLSLGLLLARQNKLDQARPELDAATRLDPGVAGPAMKARAWRALAQIDRSSDPAAASTDLIEALKISPETPRDTLLAAELADATNQPDAAEAAYKRVLANDPKNAEARAGLAHLLLARKQYPEAETVLRAALADSPDNPALTAELATALAAQDKGEALPLLQKLHEAHPDDADITRMLAEVLAESGDAAGSDLLYTGLLKSQPKNTSLLIAHGQNLIRL
ncbi:MAG TPA: tetratricopeptide repeat protein, partial [Terriglobales bacterium]